MMRVISAKLLKVSKQNMSLYCMYNIIHKLHSLITKQEWVGLVTLGNIVCTVKMTVARDTHKISYNTFFVPYHPFRKPFISKHPSSSPT